MSKWLEGCTQSRMAWILSLLTTGDTPKRTLGQIQSSLSHFRFSSHAFLRHQTSPKNNSNNLFKDGHQLCESCEELGPKRSYCNICGHNFCDECWQRQLPHKKKSLAPGGVPHEKTDRKIAKKIQDILTPNTTAEEQLILHQNDQNTTWFGIIREDGELPLFRDYGRYGELMANKLRASNPPGSHDTRYPSLVSFVGQTGECSLDESYKASLTRHHRCRKEHHHQVSD